MKDYLIARAKEASTWRGIIFLLTSAGLGIAPELATLIVTVGTGAAGIVGIVTADKKAGE
jgi:hypothetical protein